MGLLLAAAEMFGGEKKDVPSDYDLEMMKGMEEMDRKKKQHADNT